MRMVLEDVQAPYVDVARLPREEGGGIPLLLGKVRAKDPGFSSFAVPIVEIPDENNSYHALGQTANICAHLAERHGLVSTDALKRAHALGIALTICDVADETHNVHHPVSSKLYYEDQKDVALRVAHVFCETRLGELLGFFETILAQSGGPFLCERAHSYVDLMLFQLIEGLNYAFPKTLQDLREELPLLFDLCARVRERPALARYLQSDRRLPFNLDGLFRHYPELDLGLEGVNSLTSDQK